jgi:hypothetical protein
MATELCISLDRSLTWQAEFTGILTAGSGLNVTWGPSMLACSPQAMETYLHLAR